jgi:hypothetical protein
MQAYKIPLLKILEMDGRYEKFKKRITTRIRQIPAHRMNNHREKWISELLLSLSSMNPPKNPPTARKLLREIFQIIQATEMQLTRLHQISWMRNKPEKNATIMNESGPMIVASVMQMGESQGSAVTRVIVPPSPVRSWEEPEIDHGFITLPPSSPPPQIQEEIYLLIDLEGPVGGWVEASILACNRREIIKVFHDHACPDITTPEDQKRHQCAARYCHGIKLHVIQQLTSKNSEQLQTSAEQFANQFPHAWILSADEKFESDVRTFTSTWQHKAKYNNVELEKWVPRIQEQSHQLAVQAKRSEEKICGVKCSYSRLHHPRISAYTTFDPRTGFRKEPNESQRARLSSGSHCSLYDAYELFLHLKMNNLWTTAVIRKNHKSSIAQKQGSNR